MQACISVRICDVALVLSLCFPNLLEFRFCSSVRSIFEQRPDIPVRHVLRNADDRRDDPFYLRTCRPLIAITIEAETTLP